MEQATAGASAGSRWEMSIARCFAAALGCVGACAWAQETSAPLDLVAAEVRAESPVKVELNASSLPRFEGQDNDFKAPRLDLSVLPSRGNGVGVAVGMSGFSPRTSVQPGFAAAQRPAVDLGVHYRHTLESNRQIDITAWRRLQAEPDVATLAQERSPVYGARVEMGLQPARKSGFTADRGFVGMQLQSGARISIKRKHGGPMIYYRNTF
jgi:hypothetical protein